MEGTKEFNEKIKLPDPESVGIPALPLPAIAARAAKFCMFIALMSAVVSKRNFETRE